MADIANDPHGLLVTVRASITGQAIRTAITRAADAAAPSPTSPRTRCVPGWPQKSAAPGTTP
ncbi:hypothetical protein SAMN05216207_10866 [Pseudonocardia ammonioxydans]|uniref:Uncharacterized protein n=1 Tax=Pseudonocardia ammonioxydans TaxID=260086 RepID=A0A1I5I5F8_PSUAM|nr:hypothetical protein [Pseudonocardia ammonioxydans]SFO55346.1 hypothetical protein SAMN05216207_10866 [Pseudonocardia ammonioxydans]